MYLDWYNGLLTGRLLLNDRPPYKVKWVFFVFLGVDAFHRKESGYPWRDFASRPDRAYKIGHPDNGLSLPGLTIGNPDSPG